MRGKKDDKREVEKNSVFSCTFLHIQPTLYIFVYKKSMKITVLTENTSVAGFPVEHGLSLHIALNDGRNILFDMGQSGLFARNAEQLGVDLSGVDLAVISHGHYDHGGGLSHFLALNTTAQVYLHREAFQPHYSLRETGLRYIGLDLALQGKEQLVCCGDYTVLGDGLTLFADVQGQCCNPVGNRLLYGPDREHCDDFCHEQSLLIEEEGKTVLLAGCAHRGMVNILQKSTALMGHAPTHVLGGMHLVKSGLDENEEQAFIGELAMQLQQYAHCTFYTMHCTGIEQYHKLKESLQEQIHYLSCGEELIL